MDALGPIHRTGVSFLTDEETGALLAAPDPSTWIGRRDRTLLLLAVHTGLRASELVELRRRDAHLDTDPHLCCDDIERGPRAVPLATTVVAALQIWLAERGGADTDPIFCTRSGGPLHRAAIEELIATHSATAAHTIPTLRAKRVSSHTLRHTAAMALLRSGVAPSTVRALLGYDPS
ncbi:tyrosine-type recombinase/integrase [Nocardia terpenica]|uniref:Tyrosine-type recombinase/integrase n=1 Tax=Nocardia terpenica TaxID=455432 RepID=A0A6G9Z8U3_9NOCA|nr:tyrosine-type recombinase/integrase [Nocardia terpenica]QIS22045.1 tyrosine-type recombinase/integrase [Nocardia terpenica]